MTNVPFAYFGTPYVARDTLAALLTAEFRPAVVVTSPDAARGRGLALAPTETKTIAEAESIPVLCPEKLDADFLQDLAPYGCQYAVVVAYGKLLPQVVLDAFPQGVLNVHYSLLPKYRGASPVEAALREGDPETGVTIQKMALRMDAGEILAQRVVPIEPDESIRELRPRLIIEGAALLIETLPAFLSGAISPVVQDENAATYAGKIRKEEGRLSLKGDPKKNWCTYRAFAESPGTYFYAHKNGKRIRVKILRASYKENSFVIERIVPESKAEQDFTMLVKNGWETE